LEKKRGGKRLGEPFKNVGKEKKKKKIFNVFKSPKLIDHRKWLFNNKVEKKWNHKNTCI